MAFIRPPGARIVSVSGGLIGDMKRVALRPDLRREASGGHGGVVVAVVGEQGHAQRQGLLGIVRIRQRRHVA